MADPPNFSSLADASAGEQTLVSSPLLIPLALTLTSLIEGETCPASKDVEQRVRAILHLPPEQLLSESFIVQRREAGLFVELRSADTSLLAERLLPNEGSCDELAQAAAVVLSAWLSDVHPDFAPELPAAEPLALPPPEPTAPPPQPLASAPPPAARAALVEPQAAITRSGRTTRRRWELDAGVGVGVGAGLVDGDLAGSGSLGVALVPARGWGARASLFVDTTRRAPLGSGSVSWRRWPLSLGPTFRVSSDALAFDLTLAPALSWLRVSGFDFDPGKTRSGLTWAGTFDARLAARGKVGWLVAVNGQAYFAESSAYVADAEYVLPRFVISVLVGARVAP